MGRCGVSGRIGWGSRRKWSRRYDGVVTERQNDTHVTFKCDIPKGIIL